MKSHSITLLPGDGIGVEVLVEARKVLEAAARRFGGKLEFQTALIGGAAIDAMGSALPEETIALCKGSDAVLLGAVGGPKWDDPNAKVRPEQGLLGIRKALGLFANLRPVKVHPALIDASPLRADRLEGVDLMVVRELTGGLYFGPRGRRPHATGEEAFDTMVYSTGEIERIVRLAADLARKRRRKLASIDKANVLESSRLWRATVDRVMRQEFPDIAVEHVLVDAASMHLIQRPARFDVMVTENMFGDILTDEASVLAGSMGMLPSASLGASGPGLYEPIHGSAPDIAGQGVANPLGAILSAAMMCRLSLNWPQSADAIEAAVSACITAGVRTRDIAPPGMPAKSTSQIGDEVAARLA